MLTDMHLHSAAGVEMLANLAEHIVPAPSHAPLNEADERREILVERFCVRSLLLGVPFENMSARMASLLQTGSVNWQTCDIKKCRGQMAAQKSQATAVTRKGLAHSMCS
jgi:hypothetical protein